MEISVIFLSKRLKRKVFRLHSSINSESKSSKPKKFFALCGMVIMYCQLGSLMIFSSGLDEFTSNTRLFFGIIRPDLVIILYGYQTQLTIAWLALTSAQLFLKIIGFFYALTKKEKCMSLNVYLLKFICIFNNDLLRIPIALYGLMCVLSFIGVSVQPNEFSNEFIEPSLVLSLLILFLTLLYFTSLFFDIVFGNQPEYSENSSSRAHSIIQVQEYFIIIVIIAMKLVISYKYNYILYIVSSSYMVYSYYAYLPYFSTLLNYTALISWAGILLETILLLISLLIGDNMIFQINFLFLLPAIAVISWSVITKRINYIKNLKEPPNPYLHELKIRFYLFSLADEITEEDTARIFKYFKQAGDRFFHFPIQYIWESIIINKFMTNPLLSLRKLAKIETSQNYKKESYDFTFQNFYSYPISLEIEYYSYALSSRINKLHCVNDNEKAFLTYFNCAKEYSCLDLVVTESIVELISLISSDCKTRTLESKLLASSKLIYKLQAKARKIFKKFGMKKEFCVLYKSLFQDILKAEDFENIFQVMDAEFNDNTGLLKEFGMNDKDPMLLISGYYQDIGEIIGGNKGVCDLLGFESVSQIVGKSFKEFLPKPFSLISNEMIIMYLFYCNELDVPLSTAFIIDINKNCIKVSVNLRIIFYKNRVFIIAKLKATNPAQTIVLYDSEGSVVSSTKKAKTLLLEVDENGFIILSDIRNYIATYENDCFVEYNENGISLLVKKSSFVIGTFSIYSLTIEDHKHLLKRRSKALTTQLKQKKIEFLELSQIQPRNQKNSNLPRKSSTLQNIPQAYDFTNDTVLKTTRFISILSITIKSCVCVHFMLSLIIVIILFEITSSLSVNNIIFETGLMRFLSASILKNIRSIDLVSQNYTLANPSSTYVSALLANSFKLDALLHTYKEFQIPVLNKNQYYFDTTTLFMYNQQGQLEKDTLYDAVNQIVLCAQIIANSSNFLSQESQICKLYAYSNIPSHYLPTLNNTVFDIMTDLMSSIDEIFSLLSYTKLICFFPPAVILLVSLYCLSKIENLNKAFWLKIGSVQFHRLLQVKATLIDRLSLVHNTDFVEEGVAVPSAHSKHYRSLIFWPSLKLLMYALITVAFYFSIAYGPELLLSSLMKLEVQHTCIGGLRRMLSPYTLFWGREAILEASGSDSYIDILKLYEVPSAVSEMHRWDDYFVYIQDFLMNQLHDSVQSRYRYSEYLELMKGDSCSIVNTVANCSGSIVALGVDTGTKMYLQELEINAEVARTVGFKAANLKKIEKYSKAIENSQVFGLQVYSNYTDGLISDMKNTLMVEVWAFFILIGAWYALMMHGIIKEIMKNINEKMKILSIFTSSTKKGR